MSVDSGDGDGDGGGEGEGEDGGAAEARGARARLGVESRAGVAVKLASPFVGVPSAFSTFFTAFFFSALFGGRGMSKAIVRKVEKSSNHSMEASHGDRHGARRLDERKNSCLFRFVIGRWALVASPFPQIPRIPSKTFSKTVIPIRSARIEMGDAGIRREYLTPL